MKVLIIDGQGGKLGKMLVEAVINNYPSYEITAVGTNSTATESMLKGGAKLAATGENAVVVAARTADCIIGPIGIVVADSMLGEITPATALAVAQSSAEKILLAANRCGVKIAGFPELTMAQMVSEAVKLLG